MAQSAERTAVNLLSLMRVANGGSPVSGEQSIDVTMEQLLAEMREFIAGSGGGGGQGVQDSGWVDLTNAEFLALFDSPKLLVAGVGTDLLIPLRFALYVDMSGAAIDNLPLTLKLCDDPDQYDPIGAEQIIIGGLFTGRYLQSGSVMFVDAVTNDTIARTSLPSHPNAYSGSGLYLYAVEANPTGGDDANVYKARVWYTRASAAI